MNEYQRLTAHQHAAAVWLASVAWGGKALAQSSPDNAPLLGYGAAVVTACLFMGAICLQLQAVRRWMCWTDALTLRGEGWGKAMLRYARRWLALTVLLQLAAFAVVPNDSAPLHRAALMFVGWYPFGMLAIMTTVAAIRAGQKTG